MTSFEERCEREDEEDRLALATFYPMGRDPLTGAPRTRWPLLGEEREAVLTSIGIYANTKNDQ